MIVRIEMHRIPGKQGQSSIVPLAELAESPTVWFAHGMDEAIAWIKQNPPFDEIEPTDLYDGRFALQSEWVKDSFEYFRVFDPDYFNGATHMMTQYIIAPVNTIR